MSIFSIQFYFQTGGEKIMNWKLLLVLVIIGIFGISVPMQAQQSVARL
jgi:hypothetical protein